MKLTSIAALWFAVQIASLPARAGGTIKEADYPIEYEVASSGKTAKMAIRETCSMTLHDRAKPNTDLNVQRSGIGPCHVLQNGMVYRGRENQKENRIELVILVGKDKARIENWRIVGTVSKASSPGLSSGS